MWRACCLNRKQLAAGLWARAERAGAQTQLDRRNFGISDDVYAAGLLLAYMAFVPFCEPGSVDAPSLQRCAMHALPCPVFASALRLVDAAPSAQERCHVWCHKVTLCLACAMLRKRQVLYIDDNFPFAAEGRTECYVSGVMTSG